MKSEHKTIIEKAKKDGLLPMEMAAELLVHDMVVATREEMCRYEVGFRKMTEKQQDTVLNSLQDKFKAIADIAARVIAGGGAQTVPMTLKDLKIANGTLTGIVNGSEQHFNDLISKVQDKSEVLIVLHPRDYDAGLNAIQPDKDQRELSLDKPAGKGKAESKKEALKSTDASELTEGMIRDAITAVQGAGRCMVSDLQNLFKCNNATGRALAVKLNELGIVGDLDNDGNGPLVHAQKLDIDPITPDEPTAKYHAHDLETDDDGLTLFCEELVARATDKTIEDGKVSRGGLAITFDLDDAVAQQVIDAMKEAGVLDADEQVVTQPAADDSQME